MAKIILLVVAALFAGAVAVDYCNPKLCERRPGTTHTMCLFPSPRASPACGQVYGRELNSQEINEVVNKHNNLRQFVASGRETRGSNGPQPGTNNMPMMSWDKELALIAQRWADQCQPGHDQCRDVERYAVGQNMAMKMSTGNMKFTLSEMIQSWYDEVAMFDRNEVNAFRGSPGIGHYTQIVWAKSTKIGCGQVVYQKNGWNTKYLICNYGPAGNVLGQRVY